MGESEHHVTPFKTYINVYVALLILTVITVAIATVDLGVLNAFVAMLVASVKAILVILWFMHQKYEDNMNRVIFFSSFFFLILFFAFAAVDVFFRGNMTNTFGM